MRVRSTLLPSRRSSRLALATVPVALAGSRARPGRPRSGPSRSPATARSSAARRDQARRAIAASSLVPPCALRSAPRRRAVAVGRPDHRVRLAAACSASAARRGRWLGVVTRAAERQARLGRRRSRRRHAPSGPAALHADLSERTLELQARRPDRQAPEAWPSAAPARPRRPGRYAVTDKIAGGALRRLLRLLHPRAHRPPGEPAAWLDRRRPPGDPRHRHPATIGTAASAGCLRAADADLAVLMAAVPLGTPVVIRR